MKNFKSSFIFFLVLLAVSSYAYFFEYKQKEQKEKNKAFNAQLLTYKAEDINSLIIKNLENKIVLELIDDKWKLLEPVKKLAKQSLINEVVNSLVTTANLIIENPVKEDLSKFNIKEELYVIIKTKDNKTITLKFGSKAPVSEETYVLVEKNNGFSKLVLHNINLYNNIIKNISDFRDTKIFNDTYDVDKIVFDTFSLEKKEAFWVHNKFDFSIDQNLVKSFIDNLFKVEAKSFLHNKELELKELNIIWKNYKLEKPILSFNLKDNKKLNFYISTILDKNYFSFELLKYEKNKLIDAFKSEIYEVESNYVDNFVKDAYYFFNKNIFSFNKDEIHKLEIYKNNQQVSFLIKIEDAWFKDKLSFDTEKLNKFIDEFKNLRVKNFIKNYLNFKRFELDKPNYIVNFKDKNDRTIFDIAFGHINQGKAHVSIKYNNIIYQINSDIIDKIDDFIKQGS